MKTKTPPTVNSMTEVITLENEIRELLVIADAAKRKSKRFDMTYVFEGEAILTGKPSQLPGTRLDRLRLIADELKKVTK